MNDSSNDVLVFKPTHISKNFPIFTHIIEYETVLMHRHDYIEFFYVFEGTCTHILNNQRTQIHVGNAFLMTPNDRHRFIQTENSDFLHRDILIELDFFKEICDFFSPTFFDELMQGKYHLHFNLSIEQMSRIENFIPSLNLDPTNENYHLSTRALTTFLLNLVIEHSFQKTHNYPTWLTRLLSMLNSHENLAVDLAQIIAHFSYSKEYMRRSFKKYLGITMTDYFNKQKMLYAYSLLQTTTYSTEKICELIGIANISYFYHLFKKTFHITPHKVRE